MEINKIHAKPHANHVNMQIASNSNGSVRSRGRPYGLLPPGSPRVRVHPAKKASGAKPAPASRKRTPTPPPPAPA